MLYAEQICAQVDRRATTGGHSLRVFARFLRVCNPLVADYTVMGMEFAENLLLLSRVCSNAHKTYILPKVHDE